MEMDIVDQIEPAEPERESPQKPEEKRLNMRVALTVALLATFMGVTKVKDDNIVQAMLQAKSDAVDTWAQYQAKSLKQVQSGVAVDDLSALRSLNQSEPPAAQRRLDARIAFYRGQVTRYESEKEDLKKKAEQLEATYDRLNYHDDQFDLSDASLSIALALLAITALTHERWLYKMAVVIAAFGLVMGLAGLFDLRLHPTALTRLLS
jgi:hypothetical protein